MSSAKRARKRANRELGGVPKPSRAKDMRALKQAMRRRVRRADALSDLKFVLGLRGLTSGMVGEMGRGLVRPLSVLQGTEHSSESYAEFNEVLDRLRAGGS